MPSGVSGAAARSSAAKASRDAYPESRKNTADSWKRSSSRRWSLQPAGGALAVRKSYERFASVLRNPVAAQLTKLSGSTQLYNAARSGLITVPVAASRWNAVEQRSEPWASALVRGPGSTMPVRFSGSASAISISSPASAGAADVAQQIDRFGPRELFAHEAGDKTAAANFAARFHAAQR